MQRRWRSAPLPALGAVAPVQPHVQTPAQARPHAVAEAAPRGYVDPVCGMSVTPESAAARREVDGTTVYFCSASCAAAFDADPHRYHAPAAA